MEIQGRGPSRADVESAIAAGATLDDRRRILERTVAEHQRSYDLAATRYRVGSGDLRAVQQQLVDLDAARVALLRVRSEELLQRIRLHLALGGSFEEAPATADASQADTEAPRS